MYIENKKMEDMIMVSKYYLGLDIGTSSIGWACTDENYNILNFNRKATWGARLFPEGKTAAERRAFRTTQRRNMRKKQRLNILREFFADEINNIDPTFYIRMDESNLYLEDKSTNAKSVLFNQRDFTDKDYFSKYPTIYHLRAELCDSKEPHDIRLVYLALHHILKHRGHFLIEGEINSIDDIKLTDLITSLEDAVDILFNNHLKIIANDKFESALKTKDTISNKKKKLQNLISVCERDNADNKTLRENIAGMLAGSTVDLSELFNDENLKEADKSKFTFKKSYDTDEPILRDILNDRMTLIDTGKLIYDWAILQELLSGFNSISKAKVSYYNEHAEDLAILKKLVRELLGKEKYITFFKSKTSNNYSSYIKNYSEDTVEKFYSCLKKELFEPHAECIKKNYPKLYERYEKKILLPIQKNKDNSLIPYQIHKLELVKILENASTYLPFLNNKDEYGSIKDKIISLLTFRIPYYVGPLNQHSKFAWIEKKPGATGPIYPWNFDKIVDKNASAQNFIIKMIGHCSYLPTEKVIPKNSIIYQKFILLNELNNIKIDGDKLSYDAKKYLLNHSFKYNRPTRAKKLLEILVTAKKLPNKYLEHPELVTGIDGEVKGNMYSYNAFKNIWNIHEENDLSYNQQQLADNIIRYITLFGEDRNLLKNQLKNILTHKFTEQEVKDICNLRFKDWGNLSLKFLTEIKANIEGERLSILEALEKLPLNLMELLGTYPDYLEKINELNKDYYKSKSIEDIINDSYTSPAVKKSIRQTIHIIKELTKIMGGAPTKVFLEMARGGGDSGRTIKRKQQLQNLYEACKNDVKEYNANVLGEIDTEDERKLNSDKLFLYYLQMGKCMYTGEIIEITELQNYDIDHIYPQSAVKDDSLDNRVLVKGQVNKYKSDNYPLPATIRDNQKVRALWGVLLKNKLMTQEKYNRLIRATRFTEEELVGFISRQLVETRQSTKVFADLIKQIYPNTELVYVKAGNVNEFRQGVNDLEYGTPKEIDGIKVRELREKDNEFLKIRDLNNIHHAKDAYLNIIVGNVYSTKFTKNPRNFIKTQLQDNNDNITNTKKLGYSLRQMYTSRVNNAWEPSILINGEIHEGTMAIIKKYMRRNNVQITRAAFEETGKFFKLNILPKGKGQVEIKGSGPLSNIKKYGGYNQASTAYFYIVNYKEGKKNLTSVECVLLKDTANIKSIEDLTNYFIQKNQDSKIDTKSVRILVPKLLINSIFEENKYRTFLTGRTGNQIILRNNIELCIEYKYERYIKSIFKICQSESFISRKKNKNDEILAKYVDNMLKRYGISAEINIEVFDYLASKLNTPPYSVRYAKKYEDLMALKDKFIKIDVPSQCYIISKLLGLFKDSASEVKLDLLDSTKDFNNERESKKIGKRTNLALVFQSITGLYEKKVKIGEL